MSKHLIAVLFVLILTSGCSVERLAVRSTIGIIENSLTAIEAETDLILAEQSIASNLKLLEGLIKSDPGNKHLFLLATRGFTSYALGFVEATDPERAKHLYHRARDYGLQALKMNRNFARSFDAPFEIFEQSLRQIPDRDIPLLYWTANSWAAAIKIDPGSPSSLADLPRVEAMMQEVMHRDETYYFAGPHLFFGIILSSKPVLFGGNPEKGRTHFERAIQITEGKFLFAKVFFAQTYAVQTLDEELFEKLLHDVLNTPVTIMPDQSLVNSIAHERAARLLNMKDELF